MSTTESYLFVKLYPSLNQFHWLCRRHPIPECLYILNKQKKILYFSSFIQISSSALAPINIKGAHDRNQKGHLLNFVYSLFRRYNIYFYHIMQAEEKIKVKVLGISMIVCKNPINNKYLVIQQIDQSWWIPGGRVDAPETFVEAGIRQCKEEAGIDVQIKGVLRMEHNFGGSFVRLKSILYAEPIDPHQPPKSVADKESIQGKYLTLDEIWELKKQWREHSIYKWPKYLQEKGKIYPLSILSESVYND